MDVIIYPWWNKVKGAPVDFTHKGPIMHSFDISLLLAWTILQTKESSGLVIWDALMLIWCHCDGLIDDATIYVSKLLLNLLFDLVSSFLIGSDLDLACLP